MKKTIKGIKVIIVVVALLLVGWFLIVSPMLKFQKNEKNLEDAARRYFEINTTKLPTGERVKTITLGTLYHESYIKDDIFIPYTHKTCSVDNSWVKVRKENGVYKYYTYLECGPLKSNIDHEGPVIKLAGKKEITLGINEEFKDPGVTSVIDKKDGTSHHNMKIHWDRWSSQHRASCEKPACRMQVFFHRFPFHILSPSVMSCIP